MIYTTRAYVFILPLILLWFPLTVHAEPIVYVDPDISRVGMGQMRSVDLRVQDVDDLFGVNIDLHYDSEVIAVESIVEGDFLNQSGTDPTSSMPYVDNHRGLANIGITRLGDIGGVSGSGILCTIQFRARTPGTTQLTIDDAKLLIYPTLNPIPSNVLTGIVVVKAPPQVHTLPDLSFSEGGSTSLDLDAYVTDSDDPPETLHWTSSATKHVRVTIHPSTHVATFSSPGDWNGSETILFTVSDSLGLSDSASLDATVFGVNDAPQLAPIPDTTATVGIPFRYQAEATDPDMPYGDHLSYEDDTDLFDISPTGRIDYRPQPGHEGVHLIAITVTDGEASAVQSFTLTIFPRPQVVINEVLADPPPGLPGDANRDGLRDSSQDEFIELLNIGDTPVDIGGWLLGDRSPTFQFPEGTLIAPGEYVVLFGGGTPEGFTGKVFTDDGTLGGGLANAGDEVYLIDPAGPDTIAHVIYERWDTDESYVRWPEGSGGFVPHTSIDAKESPFSPGGPPMALNSLVLSPESPSIRMGDTQAFALIATYSDGSMDTLTTQATWSSSVPDVATIDSTGTAYPLSPGDTDIVANWKDVTRSTILHIAPLPSPLLSALPDQTIVEGERFSPIHLDDYVHDPDNPDTDLSWTVSGNIVLTVKVDDHHIATWTTPAEWTGSETLIFVVKDPYGASARDTVVVTVVPRLPEKGDVNKDGNITQEDVDQIVEFILREEGLSIEQKQVADVNNDGQVDILDVIALTNRIHSR